MFESAKQALSALQGVGYFTDQKTATTVFLAAKINKPILLEGPAGAGKTELAQSVARAAGTHLIRLQCYQGIDEEKAIGQFDKSLQELFVLLKTKTDGVYDWDQIRKDVTSRAFFLAGPLLTASNRRRELFCLSTRSIKWTTHSKLFCWSCFLPGQFRYRRWVRFRRPPCPSSL